MTLFRTVIGNSAEGEFYFARPYLDTKIWKYLKSGGHLLVSAPRRVGKTSFLLNICTAGKEGYIVKYHITQSINRSNEFFKRLYKSLLEELSENQNIWQGLTEILKKNGIKKLGPGGIELNNSELDYFEEFKRLVIKTDIGKQLVFVIDEFSETTENIINDHGESAGQLFLHQNRELRQDKAVSSKIQFIYSGSIGLGNIAERISAIKSINDLTDFPIPPLTDKETLAMISQITISEELQFSFETKKYLIDKIYWQMPYYLQIILDEAENLLLQSGSVMELNNRIIDESINEALKKRNYFEHWHTRLRTAFKEGDYTFAKEVLNTASKAKAGISKTEVFDLAAKYEITNGYNVIVRTLEYDGYLNLNDKGRYIFNSPLLKIWWERNIAI
jgi:uncharacterized protein